MQPDDNTDLIYDPLIGESHAIEKLKWLIQKIAPLDTTVLISGETGTGKELVARMIHENSDTAACRFIPVHAAGIPDTLLESALFGHEKGSFTGAYKLQKGYFEIASGGTIFLDEIGEINMSTQVKLLRVLQDRQFYRVGNTEPICTTARIVAATNKNLKKQVEKRRFREDLYYRLNVITLDIPPLRERKEDIPLLVQHFLRTYCKKHNHLGMYLKPETVELLVNYAWPGNIRELENVIERLVALSDTDWIGVEELPNEFFQPSVIATQCTDQFLPFADAKSLFEREYILDVLRRTQGNISKAARIAKMPRQNLHVKIKKYDINARFNGQQNPLDPPISNWN